MIVIDDEEVTSPQGRTAGETVEARGTAKVSATVRQAKEDKQVVLPEIKSRMATLE